MKKMKVKVIARIYNILVGVIKGLEALASTTKKLAFRLHLDRDAVGQVRTIAPGIVARARFGYNGPGIDVRAVLRSGGVVWTCKVSKQPDNTFILRDEDEVCCRPGQELVFPDPEPRSLAGGKFVEVRNLPFLSDEEREQAKRIGGLVQNFLNDESSQERKTLLEDIELAKLKFWRVQ
jgi:hypothetical protein